jgi:Family of unknown function (DUF6062)
MRQRKSTDHSGEAEALQRACQQEGCPVCTVVLAQVTRAMETWSYDGFTDVEQREKVTRARGFCPLHTWQLAQRNNAFQLAIVYENILSTLNEDIDQQRQSLPPESAGRDWLMEIKHLFQAGPAMLPDPMHMYELCPFCQARENIEQRLTGRLLTLLQQDDMASRLRQSTGLCRLHYALACQRADVHAPTQRSVLIACQKECVLRVLNEVRELIRKHDYRFSEEARGEEMTAWRRAIALCAGNPGVY